MQNPWERGWQPVNQPAPQSERVETKVVADTTYHLWKNAAGVETIQKNNDYYRVAPGAFNTIPSEAALEVQHGFPEHREQT